MSSCDVIVVGSGPSGAQAAKAAVELGCDVTMLDVGIDDAAMRDAIPSGTFSELRRSDPDQFRYFVGNVSAENVTGVRVGAQLTPPRQFIVRDAARLFPLVSSTFAPLQTAALGGLGSGWGAGTYTYNDDELRAAGLPPEEMPACYDEVARDIGISASADDDTGPEFVRLSHLQPPQPLDDNAAALFESYVRRRASANRSGLYLGRAPGAVLSRALVREGASRRANPLADMDFYSDSSRSVYRPRFTLEELAPNPRFRYAGGSAVTEFRQDGDAVEVRFRDVRDGSTRSLRTRRLLLAAGAIATTRIVLRSLRLFDRNVPILSNPYTYLPCVNLAMFGRPAGDRRHSLAQLAGYLRGFEGNVDNLLLSFYSYRSLLLFKLVKEMPLPSTLGLVVARLLLSSLTVVGVHHPERRSPGKTMSLRYRGEDEPTLEVSYRHSAAEQTAIARNVRRIVRALAAIRSVPFAAIDPGNGSSIHYAGGLTVTADRSDQLGTTADGRLHAAPSVYIADSANWSFLPAKGLTLSLMANARRVAKAASAPS